MAANVLKNERPSPGLFINQELKPLTDAQDDSDMVFRDPSGEYYEDTRKSSIFAILQQLCINKTRAQQVKTLEVAVTNGESYFNAVEDVLKQYLESVPSCEARIKEIGKIPRLSFLTLFLVVFSL
jgi:hypothetical protein